MINVKIQKINFFEGYKIELCLSNRHKIIYDMTSKINTARFIEIKDPKIFQQAKIRGDKTIYWNENVEVTLEEIIIQVMEVNHFREKKCLGTDEIIIRKKR